MVSDNMSMLQLHDPKVANELSTSILYVIDNLNQNLSMEKEIKEAT